jgi:hypothetical protein
MQFITGETYHMPSLTKPNLHFTWRRAAPFAAGAAVIGIVAVVLVFAAGPLAAFEAESGALSGTAKPVALTGASGGSVIQFGPGATPTPTPTATPTPTPTGACPAYPAFPDASCTGVPAGVTLTDMAASSISNGGTYTAKRIAGGPTIYASNITFINCSFPSGAIFRSGTGITISHSDFGADIAFSSAHTIQFNNNNIHDFADGVDVTSDSGSVASNITISENYIHHPAAVAPDHSDGSQVRGVAGLNILHNTYDMGVWYLSNGLDVLNSAVFFENANGGNTGIVATHNYLNGAGYALYAPGGSGSITNNTFGPNSHYGYVYPTVDSGFTRSGNVDSQGNPITF